MSEQKKETAAERKKRELLEAFTTGAKGKDYNIEANKPVFLAGMDAAKEAPGELEYIHPDTLKGHPQNAELFNPLTGADYERLKADIQANGIHDALIVTPQGADGKRTVLAGHNRLRAARELGLTQIPVRVKQFKNNAEQTRFIIRDNILRRQLSTGEKAALLARLYPDTMNRKDKGGHPSKGDTVSPLIKDIADETGLSERQIQRLKATHKTAEELAGNKKPTVKHYEKAAEIHADTRRKAPQTAQKGTGKAQNKGADIDAPGLIIEAVNKVFDNYLHPTKPILEERKDRAEAFGMIINSYLSRLSNADKGAAIAEAARVISKYKGA